MQRLFSLFPDRWPGVGLLLLRGVLGASLLIDATRGQLSLVDVPRAATQVIGIGTGLCLLVGAWTPVAAALQIALELWSFFARAGASRMSLVLAGVGASVMMLGPGAWSVDARRFGRKRIDVAMR